MKCVAIIPARGGSKGIPGKNLKLIAGRSLLQRAIDAAKGSPRVAEVYVTSDDASILAEAERCGATAIQRPGELANDTASSESALLNALGEIERTGTTPDQILFIQCTSPFLQAKDVDGLIRAMDEEQADCALTVAPFHGFLWKLGTDGVEAVGHDKAVRPRRQDREPIFLETGAAYLMKAETFKIVQHRFFGKVAHYVMDPIRSIEIDEPLDLQIAEQVARDIEQSANAARYLPSQTRALLLDFDGVMTDDCAIVNEDGVESVKVSRADGMGLERLRKLTDVKIAIVSKETNPVVSARCRKLGLKCIQGVNDKQGTVTQWAKESGVDLKDIVYVGNDVNDLPVFPIVGLSVTPSDARKEVQARAGLVLDAEGGRGAVREICELIISRFA